MGCCGSKRSESANMNYPTSAPAGGSDPYGPGPQAHQPTTSGPAFAEPDEGPEPEEVTPRIDPSATKVKEGPLVYWDETNSRWRDSYAVLYSDSTLVWYKGHQQIRCLGCLQIKPYAAFLVAGQFTANEPNRPQVPAGSKADYLIAIPTGQISAKTHWLLCGNEADLNGWMNDIVKLLPPPPKPRQKTHAEQAPTGQPAPAPAPAAPAYPAPAHPTPAPAYPPSYSPSPAYHHAPGYASPYPAAHPPGYGYPPPPPPPPMWGGYGYGSHYPPHYGGYGGGYYDQRRDDDQLMTGVLIGAMLD